MSLALLACSSGSSADRESSSTLQPPVRRVRVVKAEEGAARPPIVASGQLAAIEELVLSFRTGGTVQNVLVQPGDKVRAGQLLAMLESVELDAGMRRARETLEQRNRDRERTDRAFEVGALSREQRDNARTAEALARAELDSIVYRSQRKIVAPADGIVLQRLAEPGENVVAGRTVFILARRDSDGSGVMLRIGVSDHDVVALHLGDAAVLFFSAFPGRTFAGRVREIAASADKLSGTYAVEVALLNPVSGMATGMIGQAHITSATDSEPKRSYLPLSALVEGASANMRIFLLDGNTAREQRIAVAFIHDGRAALSQPLPPDTLVITDGATDLRDGERVAIVK